MRAALRDPKNSKYVEPMRQALQVVAAVAAAAAAKMGHAGV